MSNPRKPVLSIDLGATYTKVSWRPAWPSKDRGYEKQSKVIEIQGDTLTPTLVFDSARGHPFFGKAAADLKPGPGDVVHASWKRELFDQSIPEVQQKAASVAGRYLGWLREEVAKAGVPVEQCRVRMCLPAFEENSEALGILCESMQENGWDNSEILWTSEPLANTIGLLTTGRNHISEMRVGLQLAVNLNEMFGTNSPLLRAIINWPERSQFLIAILDIGSYTTDLSLLPWSTHGGLRLLPDSARQKSFRHGVVEQLDGPVFSRIRKRTEIDVSELKFLERELVKRAVYNGESIDVSSADGGISLNIGGEADRGSIAAAIQEFTESLWTNHVQKEIALNPPDWFILTGGGASIRQLRNQIIRSFERFSLSDRNAPRLLEPIEDGEANLQLLRHATALGGSSVIIDAQSGRREWRVPPESAFFGNVAEDTDEESCRCGGLNPECMRCGGSGSVKRKQVSKVRASVVQVAPADDQESDEVDGFNERPASVEESGGERLDEIAPEPPHRISHSQVGEALDNLKSILQDTSSLEGLLDRYTLRGWMGGLVFPDLKTVGDRSDKMISERLQSVSSLQGKIDWYRLLCFGCLLGAPVNHKSILRRFWTSTLNEKGFWEATIPTSDLEADSTNYQDRIDRFFEELIHREFRSQNASGEDAELLRRVFYDFRKMHFYVFTNDLPEVYLNLLRDAAHPELPLRFLKSGFLPNQPNWRGVIGQSMTTPLLFLMREFARVGFADRKVFHPICFYMNTPARRAAVRLGWLENRAFSRYDFESVVLASKKVCERMSMEMPEALDWFDLPLQELGRIR